MKLLAISPHLDDAAFSAGGLLASRVDQGWEVMVATCFTGNVAQPTGFALSCQLDKGLGADIDYMALRRAEDQVACEALGARATHLPFLEAPHRGYTSAKMLFAGRLPDDRIVDDVAASLAELLAAERPDLVLGPLCLGNHVDHHVVLEAIGRSCADHTVLLWEDWPYADREDRIAAMPEVIEYLTSETRARRIAACAAYTSQLGFQFGGVEAMTERTERIVEERFYPPSSVLIDPATTAPASPIPIKAIIMTKVSVVTLGKGRPDHLVNVVRGLMRQTLMPTELIVAVMQDDLYDLPEASFPIRQMQVVADALPLASARNVAARAATGDVIVFLDMDCIPTPTLLADYAGFLDTFDGLLMGEVLYLPGGATDGDWQYNRFAKIAVKHSDRRGPPPQGIEICTDYRCFWSLNFAMRRTTFLDLGGFDERYVGYGGEDTDFGKALDEAGVAIAWIKGGLAYHQYHPHHMPPVHHLDSVVRNAELFETKWGYRTMGHWLQAFRLMGLIDPTPGRPIRILRRPDAADLALTGQQSHQPYANTATVIRLLEDRLAASEGAAAAE